MGTISQILDDLEEESDRVYAWRLHRLAEVDFEPATAIPLAIDTSLDITRPITMKLAGCPEPLIVKILT